MEKRQIPIKNYIIFIVMTIAVIFTVLYTANYYTMSRDYYIDYSYVSGVIANIDEASFNNYIKENPQVVVYIADSKDAGLKSFEKKFKKLIINNDIKDEIVYLDFSKIDNQSFIKNFPSKYYSKNLKNESSEVIIPNLVYFENGEAVSILYSKASRIGIDDVKSFLFDCEVIEID